MVLLTLLVIVALIVLAIYLTGLAMPNSYTVERTTEVDAPPNFVWLIVSNHAREPEWRHGLKEVDKQSTTERQPIWRETRYDRKHPLRFKTVASEPPRKLVREIVDDKYISGTYVLQIEPAGEGSKVLMKQEVELHKPLQRFKLYVFGSRTAEVERYLADLKQRVLYLKEDEEDHSD